MYEFRMAKLNVQHRMKIRTQAIVSNQSFNSNRFTKLQRRMSGSSLPPKGGYGLINPDIENLFAKDGA